MQDNMNPTIMRLLGLIAISIVIMYHHKLISPTDIKQAVLNQNLFMANVEIIDNNNSYDTEMRSILPTSDIKGDNSAIFRHLHTVNEPFDPELVTPLFWTVPRSGTSSIKSILTKCLDLSIASSNDKARTLKMVEGDLVNVVETSYFTDITVNHKRPASVFTLFRHPVERMVSDYYQEHATTGNLMEYATNPKYHVDNWMTRMLANVHQGQPVTDKDFQYAKTVLHDKVLVLFLDAMDESVERLLTYFDWYGRIMPDEESPGGIRGKSGIKGLSCLNNFKHSYHQDKNSHPVPEPDSEEWLALKKLNEYDINLYWYAKELFHNQQRDMFAQSQNW